MLNNKKNNANLIEVFSAIQGEGLNVGTRQIFIRFALCDLRCHFCDSAHTWTIPNQCHVEQTPGERDFQTYPNPVSLTQLLQWIEHQNILDLHDSVSITGGEPLLQANFLQVFLPQLKQLTQLPVYLETGGHRPQQLELILPYLDLVGMDIKLPRVSGEEKWQAHYLFLQKCIRTSVKVFIKLIISDQTNPEELQKAAQLVAEIHQDIPVFLQPVTPLNNLEKSLNAKLISPPSPRQVLTWQGLMKQWLSQVRVVPQTHKMIGQR